MGAPKQKWTPEEEAALKAGIQKHGLGKWSNILKDPEFSSALHSRSNVDLKDKWRNLNCMANGSGSRHRARVSNKSNQLTSKQEEDATPIAMVIDKDAEVSPVASAPVISDESHDAGTDQQISRLDDLILDAITKLKEPRGSSRPIIAQYIKEHYLPPPDFERSLAADLNVLTEKGVLVKVKHHYRIAPRRISFAPETEQPLLLTNGTKTDPSESERKDVVLLTKANIDAELEKIRGMSAEEAAKAAAKAVAEAEVAIAEAEKAAREAEEAEAEAEVARCFADAAHKALSWPTVRVCDGGG